MLATTACGHQWVTERSTHDHRCHRTVPDHRAHECDCSAVELRTSPYTLAASPVDVAPPTGTR